MPLSLFRRKAVRPPHFPDGRVGFAIGDVHGRSDLLARMLDRLDQEISTLGEGAAVLVLLGDYIDRGPDSAGVIELLLARAGAQCETHFLKGNHEAAMLAFLEDPIAHRAWLAHGGLDTLASYGVRPLPSIAASDGAVAASAEQLRLSMPEAHLAFFQRLQRYVVLGDYLFVHAGVDCGRGLEDQSDDDLFWARARFIADKRKFSHLIVHGHTPVPAPYGDERRICIDTGAYATGRLTAARFESDGAAAMVIDMEPGGGADACWAALK